MAAIILAVHLVLAVLIIVLVLMQQGKGSNMGASFGSGASNTVFGSRGSMSFLGRMTSLLVAVFFASSLTLTWIAQKESRGDSADIEQFIEDIEEKVQKDVLPNLEQDSTAPVEQDQTSKTQ